MKQLIFLVLLITGSIFSFAQAGSNDSIPELYLDSASLSSKDTSEIITKVEVEAEFIGGTEAWRNFLVKNFRSDSVSEIMSKNIPAKKLKKGYTERALVRFIVSKDGDICCIKTLNNVHPAFRAEAERLIALTPKWIPAQQNGRKVKAYRVQPFIIQISSE